MKAFVTALLLALAWLPGAALAQSTPQAGRDYVEIPGAGHAGLAPEMATACIAALDRVATRAHPGHAARHCGLYAAQRAR